MAIVHKESGNCFQATASGVEPQPCQHTSSQHWYRHERMIVNLADGRCLEWDPSKNAEHKDCWLQGKVHMTECTGAPKQLWDFHAAGNVRNGLASSLCLDRCGDAINIHLCASGHNNQNFEVKPMRLKTPAGLQKLFKPRKEEPPEAKAEPEKSHKESMELINILLEQLNKLDPKLEQAINVRKGMRAELERSHAEVTKNLEEHVKRRLEVPLKSHVEVVNNLQEQAKKLETKLSESHESHAELKRGLREQAEKVLNDTHAALERSHAEVTKNLTEHVESRLEEPLKTLKSHMEVANNLKEQVDKLETKLSEGYEERKRGLREQAEKVLNDTHAELERSHAEVTKNLEEHVKSRLEELEKKSRNVNGEQEPKAQVDSAELLTKCLEPWSVFTGLLLACLFGMQMRGCWRQVPVKSMAESLQVAFQEMRRHDTQKELMQELQESRQEIQRLGRVQEKDTKELEQVLMQLVSEVKESRKETDASMILLGSEASSESTAGSWSHVHSGEPRCFLPPTYFQVVTEYGRVLAPAYTLYRDAEVVAATGDRVKVLFPPEQHQVDAVIELHAGLSFLVVSPEHRILVPGNKTIPARELEEGHEVILDGTRATLTSRKWKVEPTVVLKISFTPDLPVAAFMPVPSILSKGSREKPRLRRARKQPAVDSVTIPDTEAGQLTP